MVKINAKLGRFGAVFNLRIFEGSKEKKIVIKS